MKHLLYVIFNVQFDFALEVWFSIRSYNFYRCALIQIKVLTHWDYFIEETIMLLNYIFLKTNSISFKWPEIKT